MSSPSDATEPRSCSVEGCERPSRSRELCDSHYRLWRRHGDPAAKGTRGRPTTRISVDPGAIKAVRSEHGYSQREFALVCGVRESVIRNAEFLGKITPDNAEKVVEAVARLRAESREAKRERRRRAENAGLANQGPVVV